MTTMDKITEEIAHFIGMLQTTIEQGRAKETYNEFSAQRPSDADPDLAPIDKATFTAPFEFLGYEPEVLYKAPGPDPLHGYTWLAPRDPVTYTPVELGLWGYPDHSWQKPLHAFSSSAATFVPPELEPPGSVVTYINQVVFLSDNDYFGVGGHGLSFTPNLVDNGELLNAAGEANSRSPIGELERPGTAAEIIATIKSAAAQLDAYEADNDGATQVFVHQAETIEGVYVNGELVDEAPKLQDYYEFEDENDDAESDDAPNGNAWIDKDGSVIVEASVSLTAGENTLVNEAILKNFWTAAKVTAVVGDHFEVNAIVQINVLWDVDKIASGLGDWSNDGAINEIFNIAKFERFDTLANDSPADAEVGGFPKYWNVTQVDGDLMVTNWLEQFIFKSDNDVGVLSASGATTSVVSGGNLGANETSIFELGFNYDLIIVGGSVYDANIIQQMNVLFDNDVIGAGSGFQTKGEGSVSTSGNLLWNEAEIYNIGGADRFDKLPGDYLATAKDLEKGGANIGKGVLTDAAFAGLEGLRVLYIKGDLLNLNYIKQTSILGDSDQIALAMNQLNPHLGAGWTLATGGNALVNNAAIFDLDSFGKTYVGGEQYSQETLIQAEFVSSKHDLGGQDPDALVNEAVAFLDDSMLEARHEDAPGVYIPPEHDGPSDGGLQTMLGH